jgi:hypothetical protein
MDYTASIPDDREPCITAARMAYNASQPETIADPANPGESIPNPALLADNAAYMAWVMDNATQSYCNQYFPRKPDEPLTGTMPAGKAR